MKSILVSIIAALLITGQIIIPVAASASPASLASSETCGSIYTVQPKDNLTKIAQFCETTVDRLIALNPQITNPNIIYTGQKIRITGTTPLPTTTSSSTSSYASTTYNSYTYTSGNSYYYGYARVSLSDTTAEEGDEITVYITGFPANADVDYRVGQSGKSYSVVYDGTTDGNGTDEIEITIPSDADKGEYWVVLVTTTSHKEGVQVTSARIYIDD